MFRLLIFRQISAQVFLFKSNRKKKKIQNLKVRQILQEKWEEE